MAIKEKVLQSRPQWFWQNGRLFFKSLERLPRPGNLLKCEIDVYKIFRYCFSNSR